MCVLDTEMNGVAVSRQKTYRRSCGRLILADCQTLSLPILNGTREKIRRESLCVENKTGRSLTNYLEEQNRQGKKQGKLVFIIGN